MNFYADPNQARYTYSYSKNKLVFAADQERHGLVSMQTGQSSLNMIREPYFGLNVYRLMSSGRLMAIARSEPFTVGEASKERLILNWETTSAHPVQMTATYDMTDENTIDFTFDIQSRQSLHNYEVTICTYFDFSLEPYTVIANWPGKTEVSDMQLLKVEDHPYIKGYYVCFPRDARSSHMRTDGRWRNEETGQMIAHHVIGPYYGKPIAIMAKQDEYIVQMADPEHCNAIDTTYSSPDKNDSIMRHNALYFNLFGEDLQPGDQRTARIRQVLCQGQVNLENVLKLYDDFVQYLHEKK